MQIEVRAAEEVAKGGCKSSCLEEEKTSGEIRCLCQLVKQLGTGGLAAAAFQPSASTACWQRRNPVCHHPCAALWAGRLPVTLGREWGTGTAGPESQGHSLVAGKALRGRCFLSSLCCAARLRLQLGAGAPACTLCVVCPVTMRLGALMELGKPLAAGCCWLYSSVSRTK